MPPLLVKFGLQKSQASQISEKVRSKGELHLGQDQVVDCLKNLDVPKSMETDWM